MFRLTISLTLVVSSVAACSSGKGDMSADAAAPDTADAGGGGDDAGTRPDGGSVATELYAGPCTEAVDFDGDGTAELAVTHSYNDDDLVTLIEDDFMMDDSIERRQTYMYNAAGDVSVYEDNFDFPDPLDDQPNLRETYEYGDDGKLGTRRVDDGADGSIERVVTFEYNAEGLLNEVTVDDGDDGSPERIEQFAYDADGNLITESIDTDADGEVDGVFTSTYEGDQRTRRELDILAVGEESSVEQVQSWMYDDSGNAVVQQWDANNDGAVDQVISRGFDVPGNLLRSERDGIDSQGMGSPPDGTADYATSFGYDCWTAKARRAPQRELPMVGGGVFAPVRAAAPGPWDGTRRYR